MAFVADKEEYLGDGLYGSFDGWQFKLRAPREFGDHTIYLEPAVLRSFLNFVAAVEAYYKKQEQSNETN